MVKSASMRDDASWMMGRTDETREDTSTVWHAAPRAAHAVRIAMVAVPVLAGWLVALAARGSFWSPGGAGGVLLWCLQFVLSGSLVALLVARVTQQCRPLADLLDLSLTFPGSAPSRIAMGRRLGTIGDPRHHVDAVIERGLSDDPLAAAVEAVELVALAEPHEHLAARNTERLRYYADLIAIEMGIDEADRERLAWGVLLHDVGARAFDAEIARSAEPLSDEQWELVTAHPSVSHDVLEPLSPWLGSWRLAALDHHERWDRTGYPRRIGGRMISMAGRITAVAAAYVAMTSKRPYRATLSPHAARRELVAGSATQFDPDVVRAFLAVSPERSRHLGAAASLRRFRPIEAATIGAPMALVGLIAIVGLFAASLLTLGPGSTDEPGPTDEPVALAFDAPAEDGGSIDEASPATTDGASPDPAAPPTTRWTRPSTTTITSMTFTIPTSFDLPSTTTTEVDEDTETIQTTAPSTTTPPTTAPTTTAPPTTAPSTTVPSSTTKPKTTISIATTSPGVTISVGD